MSLKDKILQFDDVRPVPIVVPEWDNETVWLRPMSAAQWDTKIAEVKHRYNGKIENMPNWRAHLICQVLCDETGQRIFDDKEAAVLGQKSSVAIQRLFDKLAAINGLSDKDQEELEGNSEETPAVSSPSALELT